MEEKDSACTTVHFKREARSPPRLVAPGASPGSLLGLQRAQWDGEPIPPPFSGKLLDGTWRLHSPTPTLLAEWWGTPSQSWPAGLLSKSW